MGRCFKKTIVNVRKIKNYKFRGLKPSVDN